MSTPILSSVFPRLAVAAACILATVSCGGELIRTGRSPVYLLVDSIEGTDVTNQATATLLSDVRDDTGGVINDNVRVTLRSVAKNPDVATTAINSVTLTRYRVDFRRTDGRNVPGVDVPYGFDGGLSVTISAGGTGEAVFVLVRHQAKLEPPLKNMDGFSPTGARSVSGLGFLSTIAEITIYGRDANGNEVSVTARMDVHFGDFVLE
jgi:hypothetical protein